MMPAKTVGPCLLPAMDIKTADRSPGKVRGALFIQIS